MITCKEYMEAAKAEIKEKIKTNSVRFDIIQVGDNPASNSYIKGKLNDCAEVGIKAVLHKFPEGTKPMELITLIDMLNRNLDVHGIIVQLPLPYDTETEKMILSEINHRKDVDGFFSEEFEPCTPLGVMNYLKANNYDFTGKKAVVVGRGSVGKPLAQMLLDHNATVTVCHSKSYLDDTMKFIKDSDIVFLCVGAAGMYDSFYYDYFKNKDIIDITLGSVDGKLCGAMTRDLATLLKEGKNTGNLVVSGIGGVGLLTRTTLLQNIVKAYDLNYVEDYATLWD